MCVCVCACAAICGSKEVVGVIVAEPFEAYLDTEYLRYFIVQRFLGFLVLGLWFLGSWSKQWPIRRL